MPKPFKCPFCAKVIKLPSMGIYKKEKNGKEYYAIGTMRVCLNCLSGVVEEKEGER